MPVLHELCRLRGIYCSQSAEKLHRLAPKIPRCARNDIQFGEWLIFFGQVPS